MPNNPLLELMNAGLTSPDLVQQALNAKILQDIAAMRNAGATDDQIRGLAGQGAGGMNLAGGSGLLDPAAESARIASAYSLARAQLAANLDNDRFSESMQLADRAANPFNVVGYLEALKRTGAAYPLNTNTLTTIAGADTPADSPERMKLREFLRSDNPEPFAGGGTMVLDRPAVLVDAMTGQPRATLSENGPETLMSNGNGRYRVAPTPGVSRRLGRGRQRAILDMAVGQDGRYGVDDVGRIPQAPQGGFTPLPNPELVGTPMMLPTPGGGVDPLYGISDFNGDGVVNSGDQLYLARHRAGLQQAAPPAPRTRLGRRRPVPGAAKGLAIDIRNPRERQEAAKKAAAKAGQPGATSAGATGGQNELANFLKVAAAASPDEQRALREMATKQGSTGHQVNVRDQAGDRVDPNNAVIRIGADGKIHIDNSNDTRQQGSTVYYIEDGRTKTRPATQADFEAYAQQQRAAGIAGASITSSRRGAIDPASDDPSARGLQAIIDMNLQYGGVPLYGFDAEGNIISPNGNRSPGPEADIPYRAGYTPPGRAATTRSLATSASLARPRLGRSVGSAGTPPAAPGNTAPQTQNTEVQQEAAKLLSALGNNTLAPPEWVAELKAGRVPGINLLTPIFWRSLDETQQKAIVGLLMSTGWVGDIDDVERAIERMRPA